MADTSSHSRGSSTIGGTNGIFSSVAIFHAPSLQLCVEELRLLGEAWNFLDHQPGLLFVIGMAGQVPCLAKRVPCIPSRTQKTDTARRANQSCKCHLGFGRHYSGARHVTGEQAAAQAIREFEPLNEGIAVK